MFTAVGPTENCDLNFLTSFHIISYHFYGLPQAGAPCSCSQCSFGRRSWEESILSGLISCEKRGETAQTKLHENLQGYYCVFE